MNIARKVAAAAAALVTLTVAASCGARDDGYSVEIVSPAAGVVVTVPFEVTVDTSVPLGQPSEELYHLHIWFGDDEAAYLVVEAGVIQIHNAPNGQQLMHVSLRHPDHTATGADTSVELTVIGGTD